MFVTPNRKVLTIAKIIVDKWFYAYGIPACIHGDKGQFFNSEIMEHIYAMYTVKQSNTMAYNLHDNPQCERLNHALTDLLKAQSKEQMSSWSLHLPSLKLTYNSMPHSVVGSQSYGLMFGHKVSTTCDT